MLALEPGVHAQVTVEGALYAMSAVPFGTEGNLVVGEDITGGRPSASASCEASASRWSSMLAQITHEVRNPLNAMSLNAEMLSDEVSSPARQCSTPSGVRSILERL